MSRALRGSPKKKHLENNYLIALTKHSRLILKPFLESKLIFTFLKNPKKSAFKNESKCISRALARLSKKKLQKNCSTTLLSVQTICKTILGKGSVYD